MHLVEIVVSMSLHFHKHSQVSASHMFYESFLRFFTAQYCIAVIPRTYKTPLLRGFQVLCVALPQLIVMPWDSLNFRDDIPII